MSIRKRVKRKVISLLLIVIVACVVVNYYSSIRKDIKHQISSMGIKESSGYEVSATDKAAGDKLLEIAKKLSITETMVPGKDRDKEVSEVENMLKSLKNLGSTESTLKSQKSFMDSIDILEKELNKVKK